MAFKFEKLDVWQLALDYVDIVYELSAQLPRDEEYNLKSQIRRAATSITLNIAEGSSGLSDAEQARFIGIALRSLVETVACLHLIHRRGYFTQPDVLRRAYQSAEMLFKRLKAFQNALNSNTLREEMPIYESDEPSPF
ncbi:MAG: four helix bundle protein [Candidatus Promineofilum sp.]|nr:four helix bundle protein [Promineifilum sp.]MCW5865326.1 four helix bundle protein [Anaerolineae bacterium]